MGNESRQPDRDLTTRSGCLLRHGEIVDLLKNTYSSIAQTEHAALTIRDQTWYGMDPNLSVAERDRQADHAVMVYTLDLLILRGDVAELIEERDHIRLLLQYSDF